MDFIYTRISETIAYLKEIMGIRYYEKVESGPTFHGGNITEALLKLYDPKLNNKELEITTDRYFYCMKRAWRIYCNRKARNGSTPNPDGFYSNFLEFAFVIDSKKINTCIVPIKYKI
jgi:hypothetical protein